MSDKSVKGQRKDPHINQGDRKSTEGGRDLVAVEPIIAEGDQVGGKDKADPDSQTEGDVPDEVIFAA